MQASLEKVEEDNTMQSFNLPQIRNVRAAAFMVFALALLSSRQAMTQSYVTANVTIPFPFFAEGETLAAGDYVIDSAVPSSISIRSKDGKHIRVVPTIVNGDPVKKSEAKLIFVKRDGKYVLHALWGVLGKRVVTSELAEQSVAEKDTTEVPLTYPSNSKAAEVPASQPSR